MVSHDAGRQSPLSTERGWDKIDGTGAAIARPTIIVAITKFCVMAPITNNGIKKRGNADGQESRKLRSRVRVDGQLIGMWNTCGTASSLGCKAVRPSFALLVRFHSLNADIVVHIRSTGPILRHLSFHVKSPPLCNKDQLLTANRDMISTPTSQVMKPVKSTFR